MAHVLRFGSALLLLACLSCGDDSGSQDAGGGDVVGESRWTDGIPERVEPADGSTQDLPDGVSPGDRSEAGLDDGLPETAAEAEAGPGETADAEEPPITGHWEQLVTAQLGEHVLKSIWGFDDGNVLAVGEAGLVAAKVKDTFVPAFQDPSLNILNGVWGSGAADVWTVGMYGLIYHYDGLTWGMPKYCSTVADCSFAGDCLVAKCQQNECIYTPTGKPGCCGSEHLDTGFDQGIGAFQVADLYAGTPDGGLVWQAASFVAADGTPRYVSAPNALYFGNPGKSCAFDPGKICPDYSNGKAVGATASSSPVTIPPTAENVTLSFQLFIDVEASPLNDVLKVRVLNSGKWEDVWNKSSLAGNYTKGFVPIQADLSKYVGKTVRFQFYFDSVTAENNALEGIWIDNVVLTSTCSVAGSLAGKFPTLWSVWGASPKEVFAVGSQGWVVSYDGVSWQKQSGGEVYEPLAVHGVSADDVVLAGKAGLVLHAKGGGWEKEEAATTKDLVRVWGTSAKQYVAIGPNGTILLYDGTSWHLKSGGTANLNDLIGFAENDYYIVGSGGTVLQFNGNTALVQPPPTMANLHGIWGSSADDLTVVGDKLIARGPAVALVEETGLPILTNWKGVWGTGVHRYVVGDVGKAMHHDGTAWKKMDTGTESPLRAVWGFAENDIYAVGEAATIVHYDGTAWKPMKAIGPAEAVFTDVWGLAPNDVYVVASLEGIGYVLHWDAKSWKVVLSSTDADLRHVHGTSGKNVFAVGETGTIIRYDGKGWGLMPVEPYIQEDGSEYYVTQDLYGVFAMSENDVWAGGEQGVLVHYDGAAFTLAGMLEAKLRAIWGLNPKTIWAAGNSGVMFRFDGEAWNLEPTGTVATLYAMWGDKQGGVYAVGDNGTVLKFVRD
jgi:hypothetical protein